MKLRFSVTGQRIIRTDHTLVASDSRKYITAQVKFDSDWDDITSTYLIFEPESGDAIAAYLTDGAFDESLGVSLAAGRWDVSAHGTNSAGKKVDTAPITIEVQQAGGTEGSAPP